MRASPHERDVDGFDRRARSYEHDWRSEFHARVVARNAEVALRAVPLPATVLDVGCGTRALADRLPARVALFGGPSADHDPGGASRARSVPARAPGTGDPCHLAAEQPLVQSWLPARHVLGEHYSAQQGHQQPQPPPDPATPTTGAWRAESHSAIPASTSPVAVSGTIAGSDGTILVSSGNRSAHPASTIAPTATTRTAATCGTSRTVRAIPTPTTLQARSCLILRRPRL
jgi:hypothetical protein